LRPGCRRAEGSTNGLATSGEEAAVSDAAPDERGATFYTTGMEHSPTSATGTGLERTPWHATQRAAWEALKRADCGRLGGCSLRHGFPESTLLLEQSVLSLSDLDIG
jgi:hypothetical protein